MRSDHTPTEYDPGLGPLVDGGVSRGRTPRVIHSTRSRGAVRKVPTRCPESRGRRPHASCGLGVGTLSHQGPYPGSDRRPPPPHPLETRPPRQPTDGDPVVETSDVSTLARGDPLRGTLSQRGGKATPHREPPAGATSCLWSPDTKPRESGRSDRSDGAHPRSNDVGDAGGGGSGTGWASSKGLR